MHRPELTRNLLRGRSAIALAAAVALAAPATSSAAIECASRPDNPDGYQVLAVHADQVMPEAAAPPIGILDSGIAQVPELEGRIRDGANVVTGGRNTNDLDGHGTAVATVAAGSAGGVRGISPTSPVIPIKILDSRGETSADSVIAGLKAAIRLGARVVNISAAGPARGVDPAEDRRVRNAVFDVISHGIPIVAPSGNDGGGALAIPAAYPHVIAVAGTDEDGRRATFSNQGLGLDVAAPASNIITAAPSFICASGFALFTGTSFSAPAVAGAAALLLQAHPELSPAQVSLMLAAISDNSTPGWERGIGFGIVDVAAALARVVPADDAPEVDDSIAWARRHKPVLAARARSATVTARVTNGKDPADVFRVRLGRGDRLVATVRASTGRVAASIGDGRKSFGRTLRRAPRAGVYYVTVRAVSTGPAGSPYRLKLRRN